MKARRIYFARRNPDLSVEEFLRVWPAHSDLLQTRPQLAERFERYSYLHVQDQWLQGEVPGSIDGIGAFWLTDKYAGLPVEEQQRLFRSADPDGSQVMREDEFRVFARTVGDSIVSADELILAEGPLEGACLVGVHFAPHGADVTFDAGEIAAQIAEETRDLLGTGRIAVNIVRGGSVPSALISEHWSSDAAEAHSGARDGEIRRRIAAIWSLAVPEGRSEFYLTRPCHLVPGEGI